MSSRLKQVLYALGASYIILMFTRFMLIAFYPEAFKSLTVNELLLSFLYALRVDTAVILTFAGLPLLALLLPIRRLEAPGIRKLLGALWGIAIAAIFVINYADDLYFGFVGRHVMNELKVIGNDWDILVQMAFEAYWYHTVAALIGSMLIITLFVKIFSTPLRPAASVKQEWMLIPLAIVLIFLGIRGKVTGISFGISDAFAVSKLASGNLALNGTFCLYRSGYAKSARHDALPKEEAVATVKQLLSSDKTRFPNERFPLMRSYVQQEGPKKYNVVIIMLESWSAKYIDAFTHNGFKVTPHFDALAESGLKFVNFYANGQRSLAGITAVFTGILPPYGFQSFGEGLELGGLSYLASLAEQNGYDTISMQSSNRGSFRVDKLSELAGFRHYYGAEDIPHVGNEKGHPHFGVWDGDMLKFLLSKLNTAKEPFLSFAFTSTTHTPYRIPDEKYRIYPHEPNGRGGFLNTMKYVDDEIGNFMAEAKKQPWFDHTLFFFMADHCMGNDLRGEQSTFDANDTEVLPQNHIPLIVYAPKLFKPATVYTTGSQADMLPTIADLLGWKESFSTISTSLFDKSANHFAYLSAGNISSLTDGKNAVTYNADVFMESIGEANATARLKHSLLGIDTALPYLLHHNRWYKSE